MRTKHIIFCLLLIAIVAYAITIFPKILYVIALIGVIVVRETMPRKMVKKTIKK